MQMFGFVSVKPSNIKELQVQKVTCGESVTIKCDLSSDDLIWYKQDFGKVPQMVVRRAKSQIRPGEGFTDERFSVNNSYNLAIKDLKEEDTGTYFCAKVLKTIIFGSGTLLIVEAEEMKRLPPTVTLMENGDSLTLQCSVQEFTSSCGDQSVYWFRHDSGESPPGIVYTHGDGSDECKKNSEAGSPPQSCVYTLPKRKLQTSAKGTFYCAVAACGQILFGNGTEVKEGEGEGASNEHQNNTDQADDEDVLNYAAVGDSGITGLIVKPSPVCRCCGEPGPISRTNYL
ncbi:putative immune-type receptor precursor [Silurus asotus]|uniref:Immune-type receptor n=1 Tax=Silurus asotus TaxID=30991 RepID=A0AAD5F979_SILAS|nr:putative immune-type receptor precursor [Silurus asotus]